MALHKTLRLFSVLFCSLFCTRMLSVSIKEADLQNSSDWEEKSENSTDNGSSSSEESDFFDDQNWKSGGHCTKDNLVNAIAKLQAGSLQNFAMFCKLEKIQENVKQEHPEEADPEIDSLIKAIKQSHINSLRFFSSILNIGQSIFQP